MAKPWAELSNPYRVRMERAGATEQSWNTGTFAARRSARGHAATPEHPREAIIRPGKFTGYIRRTYERAPERLPPELAEQIRLEKEYQAAGGVIEFVPTGDGNFEPVRRGRGRGIIGGGPGILPPKSTEWISDLDGYPPGEVIIYAPAGKDARWRVHIHHNDGRVPADEWHSIYPNQVAAAIIAARQAGYAADYYTQAA